MWLKRFLLFLVFIFNAFYAQNKPFSLFYALDETYVNPAAMGKMRAFEGSVFYRHFFSGFNRAPNDQGLALRLPVKNLLFGINYLRNQNAQEQHNEIAIDFGYRINFSENELNMMSLGIAPIFELISFYPIDPLLKDQNDPAFAYETTRHYFKANVRIGLSYFWKNLQIGFSVPYFLSNYTQNSEEKGSLKSSFDIKKTQLFFNGQYFLDLKKIVLSFVLNQRLNLFYNTDFMVMAHIKNLIGIGAATGEYGDLLQMGVIDPAKVTRLALQNAGSIAGLILMTDCVIVRPAARAAGAVGPDSGLEDEPGEAF